MQINDIIKTIDHTMLKPTTTHDDIARIVAEALAHPVASICIPPSFVQYARELAGDRMKICTVIGFPAGFQTNAVKFYEIAEAIKDGADEIDFVISLSKVKEEDHAGLADELQRAKAACQGRILKVIIETGFLTEAEIVMLCQLLSDIGVDFIKTSTGYGPRGASLADIKLFKTHLLPPVQMKASGGIQSIEEAQAYLALGVTRLGSSSLLQKCLDAEGSLS